MSLTLKLAALAASIIPFAPRREIVRETVPALEAAPLVIVDEPEETVPDVVCEPAQDFSLIETCDRNTAMREFLEGLFDGYGGEEIKFEDLYRAYEQSRTGRQIPKGSIVKPWRPLTEAATPHWPFLKTKPFSTLLKKNGCVRLQKDLRAKGQGKPIYYRIPDGWDDAVEILEQQREAA